MTTDDKIEIRQMMVEVVGSALEDIVLPRFDKLESDVDILKQDVGVLKQDVGVLKQDVGVLKQDVGVLKEDVSSIKVTMKSMDFRLTNVEEKVDRIDKRTSENEDAFAGDILKLYDNDKWAKTEILKLKTGGS